MSTEPDINHTENNSRKVICNGPAVEIYFLFNVANKPDNIAATIPTHKPI